MALARNPLKERQRAAAALGMTSLVGATCHVGTACVALVIPLLFTACSSPQGVSSISPPPTSQPTLPAYVYPADPPLVGAEELRGLVVRLDARKTLIWVFNDSPDNSSAAALLADRRDALRVEGAAIIGLFTGPPLDWQTRVIPTLRARGANFPCAVLDPARQSPVGVWLAQRPGEPSPGVYVLGHNRRVISRVSEDESSIRDCLDVLARDASTATRPAWSPSTQPEAPREIRRAEIRLVEIASGQTLTRAEARADEPVRLARLLAEQLIGAMPEPPRVAILPLRQSARSQEKSAGMGLAISGHLGRYLAAAGWPHLVQAHEAGEILTTLDQSPLSVEFNPGSLQGQTPWQAVLVGTVSVETTSGLP